MQHSKDRKSIYQRPNKVQSLGNQILKIKILHVTGRKPTTYQLEQSLLGSRIGWVCQVCKKQCELDDIEQMSQCQHMYCNACADIFIRYKISAKELIYCPNESCNLPVLKTSEHFRRLQMPLQRKYELIQQFYATRKNDQFLCKGRDCNEVLDHTSLRCPKCGQQHCSQCHYPSHNGQCQYFQQKFLTSVTGHVMERTKVISTFKKIQGNVAQSLIPLLGPQSTIQPLIPPVPAVLKPQLNSSFNRVTSQVEGSNYGNLIVSQAIPLEKAIPPAKREMLMVDPPVTSTVLMATKPVNFEVPAANADNRASYNDDNPQCTFKNVMLWVLLPIILAISLIILFVVLLVEIVIAMGKSIVIFVKTNFENSRSKVCTALLAIGLPLQIIAGAFGAPFILKNVQEYKFGRLLERAFMFCLKFYPFEVKKCYQKAHGPRPTDV